MQQSKKTLTINIVYILVLCLFFWLYSRFPNLSQKSYLTPFMGLSFDVVANTFDSINIWENVIYSTLNWYKTNWKGMTFGLLLAAAFRLIGPYITLSFKNRGKLQGFFAGSILAVPIGICANCVAPVSAQLYKETGRADLSAALALGSHGFNFFAVILLFQILPFQFAVIKLSSLALIIFLILLRTKSESASPELQKPSLEEDSSWGQALISFTKGYGQSVLITFKKFIPFMLLGGLLGNLIYVLVPSDIFEGVYSFGTSTVILMSVMGALLPVPMLFDIIFTGFLFKIGVPDEILIALLVSLGPISIYSLMILKQARNLKSALYVLGIVVVTSTTFSIANRVYSDISYKALVSEKLSQFKTIAHLGTSHTQSTLNDFSVLNAKDNNPLIPLKRSAQNTFSLINLGRRNRTELSYLSPYFFAPSAISSGDINNDGRIDFFTLHHDALELFINTGSNFKKMSLRPESFNMKAFNIGTMVDFDNNGDLDLFLSDYTGKLVIALNVNENFKSSNMWHFEMPKTKSFSFLNALAFHDLDGDSDLDAILGVYSVNSNELHSNPDSQNLVLINKGHESEIKLITHDIPGETMSLLIKDLNGDNKPELIIGNDFNVPDLSFLSINENIVTQRPDHNFISMSSKSTMSIIAGDINNDLKEELFFTDMGHYDNYLNDPCHSSMNEQERESCSNILNAYKSAQNPEFDCSTLSTGWLRYPCYTTNLRFGADKFRRFDICDILKDGTAEKYHCMTNKKNQIEFQENYFDVVKTPRQKASNVLLSFNEDMKVDLAQKKQIQNTYWGWNSAFFDFDNDSLLDLYVVNGEGVNSKSTPNILFRNTGDRFNKVEEEVIDQNFGHTKTFTLFDYNNDGNIDFVEQSELLNLRLYQNNHSGRKKVIRLRDFVGNRFCIGCSVVASYRSGKKVKRSVVLGGGFRSFHNTDLHFGIPEDDDIISFKVNWSLGQQNTFDVKSNNKVLNTFINQ